MDSVKCVRLQKEATERYKRSMDAIRIVWELENPDKQFPSIEAVVLHRDVQRSTKKRAPRVRRSTNSGRRNGAAYKGISRADLRKAITDLASRQKQFTSRDVRTWLEERHVPVKDTGLIVTHLSQLAKSGELNRTNRSVIGKSGKLTRIYTVNGSRFKSATA